LNIVANPMYSVLPDKTSMPDIPCNSIVQDIHDILAQINRYIQMKNTYSTIDVFFYIERSLRAKILCGHLAQAPNASVQDELMDLHRIVKNRWQHDFQLMSTPTSLHNYLKDNGRVSIIENKIIL